MRPSLPRLLVLVAARPAGPRPTARPGGLLGSVTPRLYCTLLGGFDGEWCWHQCQAEDIGPRLKERHDQCFDEVGGHASLRRVVRVGDHTWIACEHAKKWRACSDPEQILRAAMHVTTRASRHGADREQWHRREYKQPNPKENMRRLVTT